MTPKSLLRHPAVVATAEELAEGEFHELFPAETEPKEAERLLFCSGKVYYDLLKARDELDTPGQVAIARLEQFYPFPEEQVQAELERFSHVQDIRWVQEEPQNMGAWTFVQSRFNALIQSQHDDCCVELGYVGRAPSASPATGSAKIHAAQQERIVSEALTVE
jgi:2-oxoglutarate dehydrogenase E1 component